MSTRRSNEKKRVPLRISTSLWTQPAICSSIRHVLQIKHYTTAGALRIYSKNSDLKGYNCHFHTPDGQAGISAAQRSCDAFALASGKHKNCATLVLRQAEGRRSGRGRERERMEGDGPRKSERGTSNFSVTCRKLSHYIKQKRRLGDLRLPISSAEGIKLISLRYLSLYFKRSLSTFPSLSLSLYIISLSHLYFPFSLSLYLSLHQPLPPPPHNSCGGFFIGGWRHRGKSGRRQEGDGQVSWGCHDLSSIDVWRRCLNFQKQQGLLAGRPDDNLLRRKSRRLQQLSSRKSQRSVSLGGAAPPRRPLVDFGPPPLCR